MSHMKFNLQFDWGGVIGENAPGKNSDTFDFD